MQQHRVEGLGSAAREIDAKVEGCQRLRMNLLRSRVVGGD